MAKEKVRYVCQSCGASAHQWNGQCGDCQTWNSLVEVAAAPTGVHASRARGFAGEIKSEVRTLSDVDVADVIRIKTQLPELDRVLGGGLVPGSVVLIGGDPGIGKSTLLLQTLGALAEHHHVLYVTGEESLQQVALRARRLSIDNEQLGLLAHTQVEQIILTAGVNKPKVLVIDAIQTIYTSAIQSAPGSVSQVRESAAQLVQFAKQAHVALFLVGHVTKEGAIAGPRILEHMVDTVLYFEGQKENRFRLIRAVKNRFGAVNELGIFAMTDKGLREVNNPSAIFLSQNPGKGPGSVIMVTWEGTRPMLVEVQALVDQSHMGQPRRVSVGIDPQRLTLCLAVLHRHGQVPTYDQDVFINAVGGVRLTETGADLAVMLAVVSSLRDRPLPSDLVVFGELGLGGEIRPIQGGQERLSEAAKHGFKRAIVPRQNMRKSGYKTIDVVGVDQLTDALAAAFS